MGSHPRTSGRPADTLGAAWSPNFRTFQMALGHALPHGPGRSRTPSHPTCLSPPPDTHPRLSRGPHASAVQARPGFTRGLPSRRRQPPARPPTVGADLCPHAARPQPWGHPHSRAHTAWGGQRGLPRDLPAEPPASPPTLPRPRALPCALPTPRAPVIPLPLMPAHCLTPSSPGLRLTPS